MNSQKLAGILATIIALLVIAAVVVYGPKPGAPRQAEKTVAPQAPVAPAPAPRGPVVREVPQ